MQRRSGLGHLCGRQVIKAGLPVVTMDAELQVTTGSYFAKKGFITEAEGDQPGCLAALDEEARQMGFLPAGLREHQGVSELHPNHRGYAVLVPETGDQPR